MPAATRSTGGRGDASLATPSSSSPSSRSPSSSSSSSRPEARHYVVLVLGDIGRSPRMQYHSLSLAEFDPKAHISLVGYCGEQCIPAVENHDRIKIHYVDPVASKKLRSRSYLLFAAFKILALVFQLFYLLLLRLPSADYVLVQNPPSIPTLLIVWIVGLLRGSVIIIDWHNLGFSILSHSKGPRHPIVKVARVYEKWIGRQADVHLCVTEAMRTWLQDHFGIQGVHVLHDRPPSFFGPTPIPIRHELFLRLAKDLQSWGIQEKYTAATGVEIKAGETLFTTSPSELRAARPVLVVSSTSWTEDEDFGMLLDAIQMLDEEWSASSSSVSTAAASEEGGTALRTRRRSREGGGAGSSSEAQKPFVVIMVTGKGPQKAMYEKRISQMTLERCAICTIWLEAAHYPRLIGSTDLGISLHSSTSGIDLPMKVLDMYGCQVPVCALGFSCLPELVKHEKNGLVFQSSEELAAQLDDLFIAFPTDAGHLSKLKEGVKGMMRWEENWIEHFGKPVLKSEERFASFNNRIIKRLTVTFLFLTPLVLVVLLLVAVSKLSIH